MLTVQEAIKLLQPYKITVTEDESEAKMSPPLGDPASEDSSSTKPQPVPTVEQPSISSAADLSPLQEPSTSAAEVTQQSSTFGEETALQ